MRKKLLYSWISCELCDSCCKMFTQQITGSISNAVKRLTNVLLEIICILSASSFLVRWKHSFEVLKGRSRKSQTNWRLRADARSKTSCWIEFENSRWRSHDLSAPREAWAEPSEKLENFDLPLLLHASLCPSFMPYRASQGWIQSEIEGRLPAVSPSDGTESSYWREKAH